ncbi:MAG: phage holin family protein [Armatimonadetes bacterium]|nr:MAG: phage holin family protein [Armatimonadota bacterium]
MTLLINWLISALAILSVAYLLEGIAINSFFTALVVALVLGIINAVIRPILIFLTLPINILTLGLFTLVINAVLIMLTGTIVEGFTIVNFWWALIFSLLLSLVNSFLHIIFRR